MKAVQESINPLDQLLPAIATAVHQWKRDNTPEAITATVTRLLDKNSEEITKKLLGFTDTWGKWELDHCNGRGGDSAAGDFIRKTQQAAIEAWLSTVLMPKLTPALAKSLNKQAQCEYAERLRGMVKQRVYALADRDAEAIIAGLVESTGIDKFIQTTKLLNQEG